MLDRYIIELEMLNNIRMEEKNKEIMKLKSTIKELKRKCKKEEFTTVRKILVTREEILEELKNTFT